MVKNNNKEEQEYHIPRNRGDCSVLIAEGS